MSELPKGWVPSSIKNICSIYYGKDFRKKNLDREGIYPVYGANGIIGYHNVYTHDHETCILGCRGSVGNTAITKYPCFITHNSLILDPNPGVKLKYLKYAIDAEDKSQIITGTSQPQITIENLNKLKIKLAPINEQKRIVEKLDKLLARVEEAKDRLDKIPFTIKRFRQSVLNAAVTGELTKDWREKNLEVENTQQLFIRITEERAKCNQQEIEAAKKEKRKPVSYRKLIPNLGKDFETFEIPKIWEWVDLNFLMDETEPFCYGVVQPGTDLSTGNFLIRAGDLKNSTVNLSSLRKISSQIDLKYKRSKLKGGELLITVVGAGIGEVAIAPTECRGYNIARAVAKVPIKDFSTEYILLWLNSSSAYKWLKSSAREVARPTLNLEQLATIPVPVAPLMEQDEIVKRVEVLFKKADDIEERYKKAKAYVDKLTQSILAKAFRGELVPQDPNDPPASELLEKIKLEKEKLNKEKGKKKQSKEKVVKEIIKKHPKALKKLS